MCGGARVRLPDSASSILARMSFFAKRDSRDTRGDSPLSGRKSPTPPPPTMPPTPPPNMAAASSSSVGSPPSSPSSFGRKALDRIASKISPRRISSGQIVVDVPRRESRGSIALVGFVPITSWSADATTARLLELTGKQVKERVTGCQLVGMGNGEKRKRLGISHADVTRVNEMVFEEQGLELKYLERVAFEASLVRPPMLPSEHEVNPEAAVAVSFGRESHDSNVAGLSSMMDELFDSRSLTMESLTLLPPSEEAPAPLETAEQVDLGLAEHKEVDAAPQQQAPARPVPPPRKR